MYMFIIMYKYTMTTSTHLKTITIICIYKYIYIYISMSNDIATSYTINAKIGLGISQQTPNGRRIFGFVFLPSWPRPSVNKAGPKLDSKFREH